MREGKGRTYKNVRKIFFVGAICAALCAALLCGCSVIRIDIRKVRDLPYTVVDEYDVPEEMRQAIADQEQESFLYTWANEGRLYIARGYGKQDTAGYQIQVDELEKTNEKGFLFIHPGEIREKYSIPSAFAAYTKDII